MASRGRTECRVLVVNLREGPLGSTRRTWEDTFKLYVEEIRWEGVDRIHMALDSVKWWAYIDTAMKFRIPKNVCVFLTVWGTTGFSVRMLLHAVN